MVRFLTISVFFILTASAHAQSLTGRWQGEDMGSGSPVIEVTACDDGLCGTVIDIKGDDADTNIIGHLLFWGFTQDSNGGYSKGRLKPPGGRAPVLKATVSELTDESLTLRACVKFFCRSVVLERL